MSTTTICSEISNIEGTDSSIVVDKNISGTEADDKNLLCVPGKISTSGDNWLESNIEQTETRAHRSVSHDETQSGEPVETQQSGEPVETQQSGEPDIYINSEDDITDDEANDEALESNNDEENDGEALESNDEEDQYEEYDGEESNEEDNSDDCVELEFEDGDEDLNREDMLKIIEYITSTRILDEDDDEEEFEGDYADRCHCYVLCQHNPSCGKCDVCIKCSAEKHPSEFTLISEPIQEDGEEDFKEGADSDEEDNNEASKQT